MSRFNLDNYTEVKDRIPAFLADHPEGRIVTEMVRLDLDQKPPLVVFRAELYRDHDATEPMSVGYAYERETGAINKMSFVENCETSAIGRALANADYAGGQERPSRAEMEKVARADAEASRLAEELAGMLLEHESHLPADGVKAGRLALEGMEIPRMTRAIEWINEQLYKEKSA